MKKKIRHSFLALLRPVRPVARPAVFVLVCFHLLLASTVAPNAGVFFALPATTVFASQDDPGLVDQVDLLSESGGAKLQDYAQQGHPRLVDQANLLSDGEEAKLLDKLDEVSIRQRADLVVVTRKSLDGRSAMEFADDFYDQKGYGFGAGKDGILFLISMQERDWYISTRGFGITAVTDAGLEYMSEQFLDDLAKGEYAAAFTTFASLCDDYLTQARAGKPYDAGHLPKKPFPYLGGLALAFGVGFLISLLATGIMRSKLKSVYSQPAADSYVKQGSMKLTKQSDLFLYRHISRREKPKENDGPGHTGSSGGSSTHTSSSGATHGGGGGKF